LPATRQILVDGTRTVRITDGAVKGYADILSVSLTATGFQQAKVNLRHLVKQLLGVAE